MKVALTVNDFLRRAEQVYPDRIGVIDEPDQPAPGWGSITYREMARRSRANTAPVSAYGDVRSTRSRTSGHRASR